MTPKEKAETLTKKYEPYVYPYVGSSYLTGDEYPEQILRYAKICALVAVDEVLHMLENGLYDTNIRGDEYDGGFNMVEYWQEVKQEIEKL